MRIRREAKENFTWVHNAFIRDKRLSLDEKGLLLLMLSLPMTWKFTVSGLAAMVADGKDRISSTLKDLEKHGYLVRAQLFNDNGSFAEVLYKFSDEPIFLDEKKSLSMDDFTRISAVSDEETGSNTESVTFTENPCTGSTETEDPAQINKDNNKTLIYKSTKKEIMCCEAAPDASKAEHRSKKKQSSKPEKDKKAIDEAVYEAITAHLNDKINTNYKATTEATRSLINEWLKVGYNVEDFKTVIDRKCAEWLGTDMAKYLRPQTLFGNKFESYLNAPVSNSADVSEKTSSGSEPKDYNTNMIDLLNEYLGE